MRNNQLTETAEFIQHHLPGLDAGEYAIEVSHTFKGPGVGTDGSDATDPLIYKFAVQGPRFRLDPNVIHGVFPPNNSSGEFSNVLPHVVLTKKSLPWSRMPTRDSTSNPTTVNKGDFSAPGGNFDLDVPTWMAVLLLTADDFAGTDLSMQLQTLKIGDFFPGGRSAFISPVSGTGMTAAELPPWEDPASSCLAIDLPVGVFSGIAPSMADLFMMANVRKVEMGNKPIQPGESADDPGTYAIVMGNRIPAAGQRHLAVLVSLENMQDYLPDWQGNASTLIPSGTTFVRLPVLTSWNFFSVGDSYRFDHLLESLNGRAQNGQPVVPGALPNAVFKLYPTTGAESGIQAVDQGFVPLTHRTRNGKTTASWYRGPFVPYAFNANAGTINTRNSDGSAAIHDADALVRLTPDTGLFDLSYAAAWQLGRLLALQDQSFSTALYQWKRQMTTKLIQLMENTLIGQTFDELLKVKDEANPPETPSAPGSETSQRTRQSLLENTMALLAKKVKPENR